MRKDLKEFLCTSLQDSPITLQQTLPCKMCTGTAKYFDSTDFNKNCIAIDLKRTGISVSYYKCVRCQMVFTNFFDDWTYEDFSQFIYNDDYIVVDPGYNGDRARSNAHFLSSLLENFKSLSLLDYGSGAGEFTHEMTKNGFINCENYDPFSHPEQPTKQFDVVTAFEVIEHTPDPRKTLDDILSYLKPGGFAFITQVMLPITIDTQKAGWWYIGPRNGHMTFYNYDTILEYVYKKGFSCVFSGIFFIIFPKTLSPTTRHVLQNIDEDPRITKLAAPNFDAAVGPEWHQAERTPSGGFRWTARSEVPLGEISVECASIYLAFTVYGAASDDFMNNSLIRVGDEVTRLHHRGSQLCAIVKGGRQGRMPVTLLTPPPVPANTFYDSADTRMLGLAISL